MNSSSFSSPKINTSKGVLYPKSPDNPCRRTKNTISKSNFEEYLVL